jgi:hypothetical protein
MKVRNGFVSNSSSSSFVIALSEITPEQLDKILDYPTTSKELGLQYLHNDAWSIETQHKFYCGRKEGGFVRGETTGCETEMKTLLERIGVPVAEVEWKYF